MAICIKTDFNLGDFVMDCSDIESGLNAISYKLYGRSWVIYSRYGDAERHYDLSILDQSGGILHSGLITISEGNPENTPDYFMLSKAIGWTSRIPCFGRREITFYLNETESHSMSWVDLSHDLRLR